MYDPQKQVHVKKEDVKKEINELDAQIKKDARKKKEADEERMKYDYDIKKRLADIKSPEVQKVFSEIYRDELVPGGGLDVHMRALNAATYARKGPHAEPRLLVAGRRSSRVL